MMSRSGASIPTRRVAERWWWWLCPPPIGPTYVGVLTRIAFGSQARPNESPQVGACQSVRVLYLIIFPRPAVPASARLSSFSHLSVDGSPLVSRFDPLNEPRSRSPCRSDPHDLQSLSLLLSLDLLSSSLAGSLSFSTSGQSRGLRKRGGSRCRAARVLRSCGSYKPPPTCV